MNIAEYLPKAARTESKVDYLPIILPELDGQLPENNRRLWRMQHAAFGLASELGELSDAVLNNDRVNIAEEVGDLSWYSALAVNAMDLSASQVITSESLGGAVRAAWGQPPTANPSPAQQQQALFAVMRIAGQLSNEMKRVFHYRKEPNWRIMREATLDLFPVLVVLCVMHKLDFGQVLDVNILKLTIRYPDKFEQDKALNRDLNAELDLLRKAFS